LYGAEGSILLAHTPPVVAAPATPEPSAPAAPPPPPPEVERPPAPEPAGTPSGRRPRRRTVLLGIGAALALGAAVLAGVLIGGNGDGSGSTSDGGTSTDGAVSDTFTAKAPWRLRIEDTTGDAGGDDVGCDVTLTNGDAGFRRTWPNFYGTGTFQMQESGTFHYEASDRDCLVVHQNGDGGLSLPFAWDQAGSDTGAFQSPGLVSVSVKEWNGSSTCKLKLASATDGKLVTFEDAIDGKGPVQLDTNGPARVYVEAPTCSISVAAAR
jgi:hypothetical protein